MDRLRQLQVIVAIDEAGSLATASKQLGLSPPTISRLLTEIESNLGVTLFERSARRCVVTETGRRMLERSRRLLADYHEMIEEAEGQWKQPRGRIKMTAPLTFGRMRVLPVISRFLEAYPLMDVALELSDAVIDLQGEDFDVAIRIGVVKSPSLVVKRIGFVRWWSVACPDYLHRCGTPERPDDLRHHCWIQHSSARHLASDVFRSIRGHRAAHNHPRLIVNDALSALDAARSGIGITSVLSYHAFEDIALGRLVAILRNYEPDPIPVSIVYPETRRTVARIRNLVDYLITEMEPLPPVA